MAWALLTGNLASIGMVGVAGIAAWHGDYGWALGFVICSMVTGVTVRSKD
jgi:hypothetical protein